jgi:DNA-binding MarR family transcriptional regulator
LPVNAKKIFRLLVAKEEADLFPEMDRTNLENQIKKLQMSIESKTRKDYTETEFSQIDKDLEITHQAISIFAACGDHDTGSSIEQLYQRTRLAENVLTKNIDLLIKMNLLEKRENLYFPVNMHLYLQTKTQSEILNLIFKTAVNSATSRLGQMTDDSNEFFFASQFCIKESQLPALKRELRESILKFVDESLVSNGDRVVKVVTALHL